MAVTDFLATIRGHVRQAWRDFRSVYYANTPTWRWLKSGALVFFGFFLWMGGSVLLSVKPEWGFLSYVMAYGFLLIVWGPLTHMVVVPMTIRIRRHADNPVARAISRHSGKINFGVFLVLVVILGTITPGIMMLEFSPSDSGGDGGASVSGDLSCDTAADPIVCNISNPGGFDHVTLQSGGEELDRAETEPYELTVARDQLRETRTGQEFRVQLRDAEGDVLREFVRVV